MVCAVGGTDPNQFLGPKLLEGFQKAFTFIDTDTSFL